MPAQSKYYSGPRSRRFWSRINALPTASKRDVVYFLCCTLQDLESRVLQLLTTCERPRRKL